jgi:hypothetical protein
VKTFEISRLDKIFFFYIFCFCVAIVNSDQAMTFDEFRYGSLNRSVFIWICHFVNLDSFKTKFLTNLFLSLLALIQIVFKRPIFLYRTHYLLVVATHKIIFSLSQKYFWKNPFRNFHRDSCQISVKLIFHLY